MVDEPAQHSRGGLAGWSKQARRPFAPGTASGVTSHPGAGRAHPARAGVGRGPHSRGSHELPDGSWANSASKNGRRRVDSASGSTSASSRTLVGTSSAARRDSASVVGDDARAVDDDPAPAQAAQHRLLIREADQGRDRGLEGYGQGRGLGVGDLAVNLQASSPRPALSSNSRREPAPMTNGSREPPWVGSGVST